MPQVHRSAELLADESRFLAVVTARVTDVN